MLRSNAIFVIIMGILLFCLGMICKEHRIAFAGLHAHSNKKVDIAYTFIFFVYWIFSVCVTESYDISNYRFAYDARVSHGKEAAFDSIQFFCRDHGWSFDFFRVVWVTAVMLLLYFAIKKYSLCSSAVLALAIISPLTGFITQMRSALTEAIFLNAFILLISGKKKDKILYAVIIIISAQIHTLAYAFLIFLLINPKESKSFNYVYYIIIAIATLAALFFTSSYSEMIFFLLDRLPIPQSVITRVNGYFLGEATHFRYAFFLAVKRLFLFYLTDRACQIQEESCKKIDREHQKYSAIRDANKLLLVFLPIAMASASFDRLFNCFCLIQYAMIFNVGKSKILLFKNVSWKQSVQSILITGVVLIFAVEMYFSPGDLVKILNSVKWPF